MFIIPLRPNFHPDVRSCDDRSSGSRKGPARRLAGKVLAEIDRPSAFPRRRVAVNSPLSRSTPLATPKRPILSPPLESRFTAVRAIGSADDPMETGSRFAVSLVSRYEIDPPRGQYRAASSRNSVLRGASRKSIFTATRQTSHGCPIINDARKL